MEFSRNSNAWNLRCLVICPIEPANQRMILQIVGFLVSLISLSLKSNSSLLVICRNVTQISVMNGKMEMQMNKIFSKIVHCAFCCWCLKKIEGVDEVGCRVVSKFSGFPDHISFCVCYRQKYSFLWLWDFISTKINQSPMKKTFKLFGFV